MDFKKDRRVRSICINVGYDAMRMAEALAKDENASTSALAVELTKTALVIALVLIPIGLYYLNTANTTNMSAQQIVVIGSIAIIILVAIVLSILDSAMKHRK